MKSFAMMMLLLLGTAMLVGCSCNPGYYAPPYKLGVIGSAPAFVPTR